MENKFIDTPFDFNKVPQLDLEAVKAGMEQGNRYLEFQFKTIEAVRRRCTMILGWLFAVIVGTAGTMIYSLFSGAPNMPVIIMTVYALIASAVIFVYVIHGTMWKKTVYFPGDSPSHFFCDSYMETLKECEEKAVNIIGWNLYEVQAKIIDNKEEQMREVLVYRRALQMIAGSIIGAVLLLGILTLSFL